MLLRDRAGQANRSRPLRNQLWALRTSLPPIERCLGTCTPSAIRLDITQALPDPLTDETVAATVLQDLHQQCPAKGPEVGHVSRQHGDHARLRSATAFRVRHGAAAGVPRAAVPPGRRQRPCIPASSARLGA
ncbi:tRNA-dihydrouridine synthase domain protein [Synechococcus sp. A15-24]|nr:tRNA-dihydrouridine synthase domain protein [Synechococcus sp. A15-24]